MENVVEHEPVAVADFFANAKKELPPNFALTAVPKLLPETIAVGSVHNAICAGVGPVYRKINGRIVLERDSFLDWLQNRPRVRKRGQPGHAGAVLPRRERGAAD